MSQKAVLDLAAIWLRRAEWQPTLFANELRRLDLLKLEPGWPCEPSLMCPVHAIRTRPGSAPTSAANGR